MGCREDFYATDYESKNENFWGPRWGTTTRSIFDRSIRPRVAMRFAFGIRLEIIGRCTLSTAASLVAKDGVTLGQFGIFLLLSYAAGHFLAAIGNAIEALLWEFAGGMPSDWVTHSQTDLLSDSQIELLTKKAQARLGATIDKLPGAERAKWLPVSRQIYADVAKNGKPDRIDTFNGNYGLSRGLAISVFGIATVGILEGQTLYGIGFFLVGLIYAYRAYRFARYYARELYVQFLVLE